jgi:CRP-like cAMP-binding protein
MQLHTELIKRKDLDQSMMGAYSVRTKLETRGSRKQPVRKSSVGRDLDSNELLNGLSATQIESCLNLARLHKVYPGGFIFSEGDACEEFYVLLSGRAKMYQVSPGGRQSFLRFVYPGEALGYWALTPTSTYAASVQATEYTEALSWSRKAMRQLMEGYPKLSFNVVKILARQLDDLRERFMYLATQRTEERIAWSLLKLQQKSQGNAHGTLIVSQGFSQKDLADLAGTTIYTVSRIMGSWRRQGIVTKSGRQYVVDDRARLAEIASNLA